MQTHLSCNWAMVAVIKDVENRFTLIQSRSQRGTHWWDKEIKLILIHNLSIRRVKPICPSWFVRFFFHLPTKSTLTLSCSGGLSPPLFLPRCAQLLAYFLIFCLFWTRFLGSFDTSSDHDNFLVDTHHPFKKFPANQLADQTYKLINFINLSTL